MTKSAEAPRVSITEETPFWAKILEEIANDVGATAEALLEASPRHLPVVVPYEADMLMRAQNQLDAIISLMRHASGEERDG